MRLKIVELEEGAEEAARRQAKAAQAVPAQRGAFIAMRRPVADNPFPAITLIQSVKLWQKSYFYVKNVAPQGDYVNCRLT